ncbi:MAG: glycosyltransferase [Wenzhouxiangellaceae bacterium]|nr:glycosyltransferase [Wenzhouxiangellaceae bacterium]
MNQSGSHDTSLVTVVWSPAGMDFDVAWLRALAGHCPSPVVAIGSANDASVDRWYRAEAGVLDRIAGDFPGCDVLLLRVGLQLPVRFFALAAECRILLAESRAVAFPGSHDRRVDPFHGIDSRSLDLGDAAHWASERRAQWIRSPSADCLLIGAGAVGGEPQRPGIAHALLIDAGYVVDPGAPTASAVDPNDEGRAPDRAPLGHLRMRIESLLGEEEIPVLPRAQDLPVTLHVAHSWGGGVWRWIEDFAAGDPASLHLVLVAVSDGSGRVCGQALKLCVAGPGRGVIRELALAPMIESVCDRHAAYREHLDAIIHRFGVGRIVVSSLVGHSLECLRTGLPTLAVLHDFFPLWPHLARDPLPFIELGDGDPDLARERILEQHRDSIIFASGDPRFWNRMARAWTDTVVARSVALCAPTRHVADRVQALAGRAALDIRRVPHGFRPFESRVRPQRPEPDAPLHLLIPGQLSRGKGLNLLQQALPRLQGRLRFTALGCGREGLALMGQSGIDLVPRYRREQLPELVAALRPHAALLLSTVPETWSYTLSEMRALGLPPIATRIGSFVERIRDGEDGLLFEPQVDALVKLIEVLQHEPGRLLALSPPAEPESSLKETVREIGRICPPDSGRAGSPPVFRTMTAEEATWALQGGRLATSRLQAARARGEEARMREELERRTRWAETMERQFRGRTEWARRLDTQVGEQARALERQDREYHALSAQHRDLAETHEELNRAHASLAGEHAELTRQHDDLTRQHEDLTRQHQDLTRQHEDLTRQHQDLMRQHEELTRRHEQLQSEYTAVVNSRSWKLTRPFRFVRRVVTPKRLRQLVNPAQWIRMSRVFAFYWRSRGFRGALDALQHPPREEPRTAAFSEQQLSLPQEVAAPVRLARPDDPVVSVVIPVYNQLAYTAACLHSIASVTAEVRHEVIVVDDASSDDTQQWLQRCEGVTVLANRKNKGFIGTCNRGAEKARGRYLVFLNNDTRVTDGWLDALVETFEQRPEAGVVGARLVFADGTLQEAGGIVFRDGSGWNFGRGDDPDRPDYGFVSEADYVSGACLAISRDRFAALGGFDAHYAPAYYEDTDLCFKVRQSGLAVLYQPAATVIHFEGATSGTDESSGAKRYQAVNRDKFRKRWAKLLESHPENPGDYSDALARRFRFRRFRRRALVIDAVTPMPDHDSGSMRMFAMLRLLGGLGYRTSFMPQNLAWSGRHSSDLQQAGIEVLTSPWVRNPEDWLADFGAQLDLIVVSRHYVLAPLLDLLRRHCPQAKLIFDTVDLHFLREQREAELAGTPAAVRAVEKTRSEELALIDEADATLVVSEYERTLLAELAPAAHVSVVSNIHALQAAGQPFDQREDLVFVGGFQHPPNLDAAEWLIEEILPEVRRELPDIRLHIIGSKMPEALARRTAPGLVVHGFVPDLEPYMNGCRISVAPLRYGAGVKGKVNQAMSHGLPVVATSCAAEGMYAEHGRDILVADDAASFAAEVCRLYGDRELWQRLAENGRRNVERHFSLDAARKALQALLARLESGG